MLGKQIGRRVVCGISGGVDSSVSAYLLKSKGYDVVGAFMRNWDSKDEFGFCSADKDAEDAEKTCRFLDIPFVEVNFVKEYWNNVFEHLVKDYRTGLTPNPDILCNAHIKFNLFFKYAKERLDADIVATGHYARTSFDENWHLVDDQRGVKLLTSEDTHKDQTFFLCNIQQAALRRTLFPVGHLLKSHVRRIATENGLDHVAQRRDSTGICFIGKRPFQDFIDQYIQRSPGNFVDIDTGQVVGEHHGIHMWTIGQRCRLGGQRKPYFIVDKDPDTQAISVASGTDHPALFSTKFTTSLPHWIHSEPLDLFEGRPFHCRFRFQHTKPLTNAVLVTSDDGRGLQVTLEEPLRAITPGQFAVFYSGPECLGCARIVQTKKYVDSAAN